MKTKQIRNSFLLILTAFIWGIAFVAQSEGGDAVGPFSFNCIRSFIGCFVLLPVIRIMDQMNLSKKPKDKEEKKKLWKAGIACGFFLFVASNLQQLGINLGTPAGKAGFLTACYIVLVPILGIFFHKKCHWNVWVGVGITLIGLYLLCLNGSFYLQVSDILVILCALVFAFQILTVDHYNPFVDGVRLSCIQLFVTGILTSIPMFLFEMNSNWVSQFTIQAWIPILYAGIGSCGIAYTLQIIGQNEVNPTIASLLMSLESVFSVIAAWILLHQQLSTRQLWGCVCIFAAIILAQLPINKI